MKGFPCANCGATKDKGQWWNLRGYYKINGHFCESCYDKVSHDAYGNPKNPNDYLLILLKQTSPAT